MSVESILVEAALLQLSNEQLLALSGLLALDPNRAMELVGAEYDARREAIKRQIQEGANA